MDKKVEEIIRKKSQTASTDFKELFRQSKPSRSDSVVDVEVKDNVVIKADSCQFAACPIIEVTNDYYFYTIDGRTLVFKPNQKSPYIFLPFPLRRAVFHVSGGKTYFVTLDTSNKLQYSAFVNGGPSDERHIISRNVTQVIQQSNKIFYISTKNDFQHVNTVWDDNGVLRGRMYVPNIKAKLNLNIFYANSILFLNIDSQFQKEDGKKLSTQGDEICGIEGMFLVLETKKKETKVFLLDEKYFLVDQLKMSTTGRTTTLLPLGNIAGVRVDNIIYILGISSRRLEIQKEISMDTSPLALDVSLRNQSIVISKIVPSEAGVFEESVMDFSASDVSAGSSKVHPEELSDRVSNVSLRSKDEGHSLGAEDTEPYKEFENPEKVWAIDKLPLVGGFLDDREDANIPEMNDFGNINKHQNNPTDTSGHPNCFDFPSRNDSMDGNLFQYADKFTGNISSFEPYSPDRSSMEEAGTLARKIDAISRMQQEIEERMKNMEKTQNERFMRLLAALSNLNEAQIKSTIHESVKREISHMHDSLRTIELRLKDGASESKVLECVKKIVLGTLVPVVEASMDEMRIQVVNEMRLIQNEDHLKGVKKAVDGIHSSFNKQNEIKNLISQGLVEKAAEVALKGPDFNLEAFVSNVEISCLEHLSSSILIALLEKVLVMTKDDFKPHYQSFLYMVMMCLELDDLSDEEIQVLEILMSYINSIDGLLVNDNKGLGVIIDFQKLKLSKIKNKKGIK